MQRQTIRMNLQVISIILGGGAGTRLYPLTANRSKPAVPIAGKYRLVDIPISNCINNNINRMFVLTQFNSASLNRHIKNTYQFSNFSTGFVDILAAEQNPENSGWYQGTADAVRKSLKHFEPHDSQFALILSGDQLYQMDFTDFLLNHIQKKADVSIASLPVNAKDATSFGIMKTDEEGIIQAFIEKPSAEVLPQWKSDTGPEMQAQGREYIASMGIYIFNRELLTHVLTQEYPDANDFGKEIIPAVLKKYRVANYQFNGYWTDIGNISSFFEANLDLTKDVPNFNLFDKNHTIYSRSRMLPPAKISGTTLQNCLISDGSIILAKALERCLIGIRSRIGFNTTLVNCYMMGSDYYETIEDIAKLREKGTPPIGVGDNCFLENCILDKNCRIGNDVRLVGGNHLNYVDTDLYTIKEGIIVVKKNAVIPDGFRI